MLTATFSEPSDGRLSSIPGKPTLPCLPPCRALVVDDDPAGRTLLVCGLGQAGYQGLIAQNGAQAMLLAAEREFDVAVTDLMMPIVNGLTFLRWLREERQSFLPVLVFTGHDRADILQSAYDAGANESWSSRSAFAN